MTPVDREHVKDLLAQAARLEPARRRSFIESAASGRAEIVAEAIELLRTLDDPVFMSAPTGAGFAEAPASSVLKAEGPGAKIGHYKLLQSIGEGGFGSVFMAEQSEPVHRKVALKIIKAGMDTKQVIARFEAERQALAMMDHPNIARVLDGGATETGRPYFVMELVRGDPVTQFCDTKRLSVRQRLELFRDVCHAVQHAHQKGIIHRDIKPSNVLVTIADGAPLPKVIDFGIAKATAGRLTDKTLFTEMHQLIGTPEYMSPEQAEVSGVDIDTRSDVYALGVLLYELLAGSTPLDRTRLRSTPLAEIQRIIREEEPQRPSLRLANSSSMAKFKTPLQVNADTSDSSAIEIAQRRQSEPVQLTRTIRGDLDWIVMKCLEKDRSRRYATASALAEDVGRYLSDQPVVATPASRGYRLKKFVRRNKMAVTAGFAIAAALLIATSVSIAFALRESAARDRERLALSREIDQRERAEQQQRRAEAINHFVTEALQASDPHEGGKQAMLVTDAMLRAVEEIESGAFKDDPETEAELLRTISGVLNRNARPAEALALSERALTHLRRIFPSDHSEISKGLIHHASILRTLARNAEAEPMLRESLAMEQRLYEGDHADVARSMMDLATTLRHLARATESLRYSRDALAMRRRIFDGDHEDIAASLNNYYLALHALGRNNEAEPLAREALEMRRRLFPGDHPDVSQSLNNLGYMLHVLDRTTEAESLYREALAMRRRLFLGDHPDVARTLNNLGTLLHPLGKYHEAEEVHREALEMRQRLFDGDHPDIAQSMSNLTFPMCSLGRYAEAEPLLREALEMKRRWNRGDHPDTAISLANLADALDRMDRSAEAETFARDALEMNRRLTPGDHPDVAFRLDSLVQILLNLDRLDEAETLARQHLEMALRLFHGDHTQIAKSFHLMGAVLQMRDNFTEAESMHRDAVAMYRRLFPSDNPGKAAAISDQAITLANLKRYDEAESLFREVLETERRLVGDEHIDTLFVIRNLGACLNEQDRTTETIELLAPAEPAARRIFTGRSAYRFGLFLRDLGRARRVNAEFEAAEANLREAYAILSESKEAALQDRTTALNYLAQLYDAWHAAAPDRGYDTQATQWREKMVQYAPSAQ